MSTGSTGGAASTAAPTSTAAPATTAQTTTTQTSTPAESKTSTQQQPTPQQTAAQKEIARKFKLKIDGREEEYGENDVLKLAQMGRAADKRFQEAAQARKQAEDFIGMLKNGDIEKVLENPAIGKNAREWAEKYLANQLKREQLSPEQKKIQELEAQLKKEADEKETLKKQQEQEQFTRLQQHFAQDYDKKFTESLQKTNLPKNEFTVKRMAQYLDAGIRMGLEDIEPAHVAELVRQDYVNEVKSLFGQTDGDTLLQILGDDVANKIRKSDLARIKKMQEATKPTPKVDEEPQSLIDEEYFKKPAMPKMKKDAELPRKMNIHEWRAEMEKKSKNWK